MTKTKTVVLPLDDDGPQGFEFLLGVSPNSLCVLNEDWTLHHWIIEGTIKSCAVCECPNEDVFLESIFTIKDMISKGVSPLPYLNNPHNYKL